MADILDDLLTLARTEDTGERWKGDIAMRAHGDIDRLRIDNQRLVAALIKIGKLPETWFEGPIPYSKAMQIARAALIPKQPGAT